MVSAYSACSCWARRSGTNEVPLWAARANSSGMSVTNSDMSQFSFLVREEPRRTHGAAVSLISIHLVVHLGVQAQFLQATACSLGHDASTVGLAVERDFDEKP